MPSVHAVLEQEELAQFARRIRRDVIVSQIREVIEDFRRSFTQGETEPLTAGEAAQKAALRLRQLSTLRMKRVINCTGTVIHTGLGRAVLPPAVREKLNDVLKGYCFLQTEQDDLTRTVRERFIADLFMELTGCETAVVVNNNAGAVFLLLRSLAGGREVIISRGELVEIGGSFRIPDVMKQGDVTLVEVGTTNRTVLDDYADAVTEKTAAIMKVHQSNYRMEGFTGAPGICELTELAHEHGLCMVHDLGSGTMADLSLSVESDEPLVQHSIDAGIDVLCFSGDKILGGPQAGIILGKSEFLEPMRTDPFFRILRPGKMTLIALEAAVSIYLMDEEALFEQVPVLEMLSRDINIINDCAERLQSHITGLSGFSAEVIDEYSASGGGALPGIRIPTRAVAVTCGSLNADRLSYLLRTLPDIPVLARISSDKLLLDPRTLLPGEEEEVLKAFSAAAEAVSRNSG